MGKSEKTDPSQVGSVSSTKNKANRIRTRKRKWRLHEGGKTSGHMNSDSKLLRRRQNPPRI